MYTYGWAACVVCTCIYMLLVYPEFLETVTVKMYGQTITLLLSGASEYITPYTLPSGTQYWLVTSSGGVKVICGW